MNGNEGVISSTPAVTVENQAGIDQLRALRASSAALLGEKSKEVTALDKRIARVEKGQTTGAYVAPVVAYQAEEVFDKVSHLLESHETELTAGETLIVKITGGDIRTMSLLPNQVRHLSGDGLRRITQASPTGRNEAPRCVNLRDLPDGSFQISAGNEMAFDTHKDKTWK